MKFRLRIVSPGQIPHDILRLTSVRNGTHNYPESTLMVCIGMNRRSG